MRNWNPLHIILLGFFLVLMGVVLPMLMVMQILKSTFFLNFLAYASSFSGLLLGIIGSAWYTGNHRRKHTRNYKD
jgi:hypothetical protein